MSAGLNKGVYKSYGILDEKYINYKDFPVEVTDNG
jgi:hypothetical protein